MLFLKRSCFLYPKILLEICTVLWPLIATATYQSEHKGKFPRLTCSPVNLLWHTRKMCVWNKPKCMEGENVWHCVLNIFCRWLVFCFALTYKHHSVFTHFSMALCSSCQAWILSSHCSFDSLCWSSTLREQTSCQRVARLKAGSLRVRTQSYVEHTLQAPEAPSFFVTS